MKVVAGYSMIAVGHMPGVGAPWSYVETAPVQSWINSELLTKSDGLFLSIHDCLDQFYCDTAAWHDRSECISRDIEDKVAGEQTFDLVT